MEEKNIAELLGNAASKNDVIDVDCVNTGSGLLYHRSNLFVMVDTVGDAKKFSQPPCDLSQHKQTSHIIATIANKNSLLRSRYYLAQVEAPHCVGPSRNAPLHVA